jgi:hypothetical protein
MRRTSHAVAAAIVAADTAVSTRLQARTLSGLELLSGDMARSEAREMVDCVISQMCETLRARNLTRDPTQKIGGAASARCGDVIHEECRAIKPTSRDAVALEEDHNRRREAPPWERHDGSGVAARRHAKTKAQHHLDNQCAIGRGGARAGVGGPHRGALSGERPCAASCCFRVSLRSLETQLNYPATRLQNL